MVTDIIMLYGHYVMKMMTAVFFYEACHQVTVTHTLRTVCVTRCACAT